MSMDKAFNIKDSVGCYKCARRDICHRTQPLLALLVFMKAGGKCEAFEKGEPK